MFIRFGIVAYIDRTNGNISGTQKVMEKLLEHGRETKEKTLIEMGKVVDLVECSNKIEDIRAKLQKSFLFTIRYSTNLIYHRKLWNGWKTTTL